jgi:hypothetical protein
MGLNPFGDPRGGLPKDLHLKPTLTSWLNRVETPFLTLTRRRLERGAVRSIVDLQAAIHRYLDEHKQDPSPFTWTRPANHIPSQAELPHC